MWSRKQRSVDETNALARFGLAEGEASMRALELISKLTAERDFLSEQLKQAELLADRDTLTPTANRRAFMRELHRTLSEAERYKTPAAVLYIDLDGFKAINDGYGHAAGDAVLRQIARLLSESVRGSDVVARLGGDEFGVILNHAKADEAGAKARVLAEMIDNSVVVHAGVRHRVQASFGLHVIKPGEDAETALARADEAMYADKYRRRLAQAAG